MTPAELAAQVRILEIVTRHAVTEVFAGEYSSAFKGRGIEFADVREYQPGDDTRTIDWNVTARAGRPFVKRFTEERELTVVLAVDLSASGRFGTARKSKQQVCAEVAALLAFASVRKGDRVGLLVFTDRVEHFIPPKKGPRHALRIVRELLAFEPAHTGTDFSPAGEHLARVLHRRSVVFFVSDFVGPDPTNPLRLLAPRHDLVAVDVLDPRDRELVPAGILTVVDPETGDVATIDTSSPRVRRAYRDAFENAARTLDSRLDRLGIDRVRVSTDRPYVHDLAEFFREREMRR
jgi:uncharacterized protein (DUF58 family)